MSECTCNKKGRGLSPAVLVFCLLFAAVIGAMTTHPFISVTVGGRPAAVLVTSNQVLIATEQP